MVVIFPPSFPPPPEDKEHNSEESFNSFRDHLYYSTFDSFPLGHFFEFLLFRTTIEEFFSHLKVVFFQLVEQAPQTTQYFSLYSNAKRNKCGLLFTSIHKS